MLQLPAIKLVVKDTAVFMPNAALLLQLFAPERKPNPYTGGSMKDMHDFAGEPQSQLTCAAQVHCKSHTPKACSLAQGMHCRCMQLVLLAETVTLPVTTPQR